MPPKKGSNIKRANKASGRKKTSRKKSKKKSNFLWFTIKWSLVSAIWIGIAFIVVLAYYAHDLPDITKLEGDSYKPSITIQASDGSVIANYGSIYGEYVKYSEFPDHLINAVIATEDRRFFEHFGVDFIGLARAFYVNFRSGRIVQGGSTITQQLAKIIFLTSDRTIKRKFQEMILAFYLEENYTKEEILTIYFNRVYLGAGNYGMDAAAKFYFGKEVSDINVKEAALLAGLLKAPSKYSPTANPELAARRTEQVLINLVDAGYLNVANLLDNVEQEFVFYNEKKKQKSDYYFADWIMEQLPEYLGILEEDITVVTTLDRNLQIIAEEAVTQVIASQNFGENEPPQIAFTSLAKNGAVKAMLGGRDYKQSQFNRAVKAYRQPGSAFKFFVYLTAIENGIYPDDIMIDEPVTYEEWSPANYNEEYIGEVSVRDAFAKSINSIAVKLVDEVGIKNVMDTAKRLGITSDINRDLSSALGTSEVNLIEMTGAYAHLANEGKAVWVHGIQEIYNKDGEIIYQRKEDDQTQIIAQENVEKMNDLLLSVVEYGTGKRGKMDRMSAAKTGTSQDFRDAWFIGYTADLVTGVWMGYDDNKPMDGITGGKLPAVMWQQYMQLAHTEIPKNDIAVSYDRNIRKGFSAFWGKIFKGINTNEEVKYEYPNSRRN